MRLYILSPLAASTEPRHSRLTRCTLATSLLRVRREEEPGFLELTLGLAETGIKTGMFVREGVLLLNLGQLILLAV